MCGMAGRNIQYSCDKKNFIDNLVRFGGFTVLAITPPTASKMLENQIYSYM